jgi:hypothetical protein
MLFTELPCKFTGEISFIDDYPLLLTAQVHVDKQQRRIFLIRIGLSNIVLRWLLLLLRPSDMISFHALLHSHFKHTLLLLLQIVFDLCVVWTERAARLLLQRLLLSLGLVGKSSR